MTTAERPVSSGAHSHHGSEGPPNGARDQPRIGGEILIGLDIDQDRAIRPADETREFFGGMVLIDGMMRPR